jgi:hypothetical protein
MGKENIRRGTEELKKMKTDLFQVTNSIAF